VRSSTVPPLHGGQGDDDTGNLSQEISFDRAGSSPPRMQLCDLS
jgi:hypothetical protein